MSQKANIPPPVCQKCEKPILMNYSSTGTENGLTVLFTGGYGSFHDDFPSGPHAVELCHECGHALAEWLNLNVNKWHTHAKWSGQHEDHHKE